MSEAAVVVGADVAVVITESDADYYYGYVVYARDAAKLRGIQPDMKAMLKYGCVKNIFKIKYTGVEIASVVINDKECDALFYDHDTFEVMD